jgi:peptidoglycan-N-acetylglucosamine deacetylase
MDPPGSIRVVRKGSGNLQAPILFRRCHTMSFALPVVLGLTFLGSALLSLPTLVVEWGKRGGTEVVFSAVIDEPVVALTIDDGPSESTEEILEVLREHEVQATFFVIGDHVRERPDLARRMVEEGHELGHHMMEDRPSRALPPAEFDDRFRAMERILGEHGGSGVFRPGSGWYDDRMVETAAARGYRTVLGSVYPFDAHLPWAGFHSWYVLETISPGDIIVLHEGPERGPRTVEVLRAVLPELQRQGYRVVTVSDLLSMESGEQGEG